MLSNLKYTEFYPMTTTPQAALLREAAQNALITLDGIADTNPRDTADFEAPAEWIAWAKSRARWAADALRAPIAQEIYAERILKQMLHESDPAQATQEPVHATPGPMFWVRLRSDGGYEGPIHNAVIEDVRRMSGAWHPLYLGSEPVQAGELPDERAAFEQWASDNGEFPRAVARSGDVYHLMATQTYWLAWQARSALSARKPTDAWQDVSACPDGDVWFSLSCGHVVMGYKHGAIFDWEANIDHDCCGGATATKAMPITPPDSHGIGLEVKP